MKVLGLCGQSGAGKTTALNTLLSLGAVVCDSDKVSREIMAKGTPCANEVITVFGEDIADNGEIDRRALGRTVFADEEKLETLTKITHRYILAEIRNRIKEARGNGEKLFVVDAPLLFESGLDADCDITLAVVADKSIRINRIMKRDKISLEEAENRLASQITEEKLKELATEVISNDTTAEELERKVIEFAERRGLVN